MAKKELRRGIFITFEGIEGSGKSTQARLLYQALTAQGHKCLLTREPGGTGLGEAVRGILLHSKGVRISDLTELFLFEACRSQIVDEVIRPALKKRMIVICDRFFDATMSYQGYGGGIPRDLIRELNRCATGGLKPDTTFIFDIDVKTGLGRARRKGIDRMELKERAYHARVRRGYRAIARRESLRVDLLDGMLSIDELAAKVIERTERVISRYLRP